MKDFKKFGGPRKGGFDRDRGSRPSFGGKPSFNKFGSRDDRGGDKEMFQTTCAQCGKMCEVPFKPNGKKPVYCKDCFGGKKDDGFAPSFEKRPERSFDRSERSFAPRESFNKPSFDAKPDRRIDDLQNQVNQLHSKLDQVLSLLNKAPAATPKVSAMETPVKATKKAVAKKAPAKAAKKVAKKK